MKQGNWFSSVVGFLHGHRPLAAHQTDPRLALFSGVAVVGLMLYFSGIFLLVPNLVTILWPWRVKDFFSTSLSHMYLIQEITWLTGVKLVIFLAVLWAIFKGIRSDPGN